MTEERASREIAYFSMEIALHREIPTYAGGLGVLAGDMLRSCADLRIPLVAVTLVHRRGYFTQRLDAHGQQTEEPAGWKPESFLTQMPATVSVEIEGRQVLVRAWQYDLVGAGGYRLPVLLLDTNVPENTEADRALTDVLYGDGHSYRLAQEIVLGMGGVRMLQACGYTALRCFHLNEGHAALAALELLCEQFSRTGDWAPGPIKKQCVFTTHTPVPAGHDQFDHDLVDRLMDRAVPREVLTALGGGERLNMTLLALNLSHYVNGVARKHGDTSELMFPGRHIGHITNGVHSNTWTCDSFRALFDRYVPAWRDDPAMLRQVLAIPPEQIWGAHAAAKALLLRVVKERTERTLMPDALTLGFARRSTAYKRGDLLFHDIERLRRIGRGRLQVVFAGKAHPKDAEGKELIRHIVRLGEMLGDDIPVVYLPDYDLGLASLVTSGVDLWLNTPLRPLEASGTSGMKAAHNGVPSLSALDGWWVEGCVEGVTGWSVGGAAISPTDRASADREDAADLYDKLERAVVPTFYDDRNRWISIMQHTIALNASFFNTHRMVQEYVVNAYFT